MIKEYGVVSLLNETIGGGICGGSWQCGQSIVSKDCGADWKDGIRCCEWDETYEHGDSLMIR